MSFAPLPRNTRFSWTITLAAALVAVSTMSFIQGVLRPDERTALFSIGAIVGVVAVVVAIRA